MSIYSWCTVIALPFPVPICLQHPSRVRRKCRQIIGLARVATFRGCFRPHIGWSLNKQLFRRLPGITMDQSTEFQGNSGRFCHVPSCRAAPFRLQCISCPAASMPSCCFLSCVACRRGHQNETTVGTFGPSLRWKHFHLKSNVSSSSACLPLNFGEAFSQ